MNTQLDARHGGPSAEKPVVSVHDLQIEYLRLGERTPAVRQVSFDIFRGEVFGIVGESGSGKSTLAYSLMRYLASNAVASSGSIRIDDEDLMKMSISDLRRYRGAKAAMVFQNPTSALNPSLKIGQQIREVFLLHSRMGKEEVRSAVLASLEEVRFTNAAEILDRYPYQLSGGQQQRVCIAMALASDPKLLILDEPTTGLDLSVQAQVLKLLRQLQRKRDMTMLYISHDLSTVQHFCSRVGIMRDGVMVEQNTVERVFGAPEHPYTRALLACIPGDRAYKTTVRLKSISENVVDDRYFDDARDQTPLPEREFDDSDEPILAATGLTKSFGKLVAANETDLVLRPGEVLGIIGESGSGKSTLARLIAGLTVPDSGIITFHGQAVQPNISQRSLVERQGIQMVFQRPDTTLNPVLSVKATLERSIRRLRGEKSADELMHEVMLDPKYLEYSPKRLSGGMKQRVAIARALAGGARVVICDEATSALDPSIQSAILNQIVDLAAHRDTAIIFISHDLNAVRYVSDRVMVVYRGNVVESGETRQVLDDPQHEYTRQLVSSTVENIDWEGPEEFEKVFSTEPVLR